MIKLYERAPEKGTLSLTRAIIQKTTGMTRSRAPAKVQMLAISAQIGLKEGTSIAIVQTIASTPPTIHAANQVLVKPAHDHEPNPNPQVLSMSSANILTKDQDVTAMAKAPIIMFPNDSTTASLSV